MSSQVNEFFDDQQPNLTNTVDEPMVPAFDYDAVPAESIAATPAPIVVAAIRDILSAPSCGEQDQDELKFDVSFAITVICPITNCILDTGLVTKKIKLLKSALVKEMLDKSASTRVTEAVIENVKPASPIVAESKAASDNKTLKRLRELAGIPNSSNWV